ncbi:MAG: hypothetical protein CV088_17575 [Nitrospira sp. LK70]|nr:hypothetical protein [Nitrospira sp. LK70]
MLEQTAPQPKPSQATRLIALADEATCWHTPEGEAYATIQVAGHHEHHRLRQKMFRQWLAQRYYQHFKGAPSAQALSDALAVLEAKAHFEGDEHHAYVRVAEYGGVIYLDLANEHWEAVAISPTGWQVIANPPVAFRRSRGMLALPIPQQGGSVKQLSDYINLDAKREGDWHLLIACLLAMFRPKGPYPILIFHGEQGSAKSTTVKLLRMLVDPNKSLLRAAPRDERDLMIAACNGWVLAYDNLSHLDPWLSDGFCRLSTGGGLSTRELYSDADELLLEAQRPVIFNGIEELATRPDVLDRGSMFCLPTISKENRRTEADLWQQFEHDRPYILGALLDAVCGAMRDLASTKLESLPRMADFATWATAAEKALGWNSGTFMKSYTQNQEEANDLALDASPLTGPLKKFLTLPTATPSWTGSATDLLMKLHDRADEQVRRLKSWPSTPRALSNALRRLAPNLRASGIALTFSRINKGSSITIEHSCESPTPAAPPTPSPVFQGVRGVDEQGGVGGGDLFEGQLHLVTPQFMKASVGSGDGVDEFALHSHEEVISDET